MAEGCDETFDLGDCLFIFSTKLTEGESIEGIDEASGAMCQDHISSNGAAEMHETLLQHGAGTPSNMA